MAKSYLYLAETEIVRMFEARWDEPYVLRIAVGGNTFGVCPWGGPGDSVWVKETWSLCRPIEDCESGYVEEFDEWTKPLPKTKPSGYHVLYRSYRNKCTTETADDHRECPACEGSGVYVIADSWERSVEDRGFRWRPSATMPKWASRIDLKIVDVEIDSHSWLLHVMPSIREPKRKESVFGDWPGART